MSLLTRVWICDYKKQRFIYDLSQIKLISYNVPKDPSKLKFIVLSICLVISSGSGALAGIARAIRRVEQRTKPLIQQPYLLKKVLLLYLISIIIGSLFIYFLSQRDLERAGRTTQQNAGIEELKQVLIQDRNKYNIRFKLHDKDITSNKFGRKVVLLNIATLELSFGVLSLGLLWELYDDNISIIISIFLLEWIGFAGTLYAALLVTNRKIVEHIFKVQEKKRTKNAGVNK